MALTAGSKEILRRWQEDDHHPLFRWWMKVCAFWYNKVPRKLRLWGLIHLTSRGLLIASAPAIAVIYGTITLSQASIVGASLIALNLFTSVADRLSKQNVTPPDFASDGLVRVGDLLSAYKNNAIKAAEREAAIEACLGIIESIALPQTKSQKGAIAVTLLVYQGSGNGKMRVRQRNPGNSRPKNRGDIDTERVLGHYVCQRGNAPLTINHIGHFGKEFARSPTQTKYDYKSILLIPIRCDTANGEVAKGFVSVDCNHPYAFYGNRANAIAVMANPIISQLREMI
jgi:hypothetical protein